MDGYRAQRGAEPVWEGTKTEFSAIQNELTTQPRGEKARRMRVIWDKGWHGGYRAKGDCEEEETNVYCVVRLMDKDTG